MARKRQYQLLCPIGRALDVLGDRWALLVLRDLHAGPARFQQLQDGLGMASNLLTTRLAELTEAGLVEQAGIGGQRPYRLTALGGKTDRLLWELARFGALIARDPEPRPPGNLRTIALPLRFALEAAANRPRLTARLLIGDDTFTIDSSPDAVEVRYGDDRAAADITVRTAYEPFLDLAEGLIGLDTFAAQHLEVVEGDDHLPELAILMNAALG